jgi:glycosyltransferase involved in cell wall biosynthesis
MMEPLSTRETLKTGISASECFLRANSAAYERLVDKIRVIDLRKNPEAVLGEVTLTAQVASEFHPGRFADGTIENPVLEIGAELGKITVEDRCLTLGVARGGRRRVLHVATQVVGIGGHTRMLYHWVQNDKSSCHSLVLVRHTNVPVPLWLHEAIWSSGGQLMILPQGSGLCHKAKWLREIAKKSADLVVLHHDPSDVVPIVAFAIDEGPPVVRLNIADHQFWLGSSVADMVINLRTAGAEHTAKRRFVSSNAVIPIPMADPIRRVSRRDARRILGINEDQVMLLSVGRDLKYRPCGSYDFVATANRILDRHPSAHLYVVGESAAGIAPYLRCTMHERLHFSGSMDDPSLYRAAADVYLESFPFGSQTALLEAALSGLPVVPAYAPLFPLLVANDDAIQDLIPNPNSEQEYVDQVDLLIQHPEQQVGLGAALRERLVVDHMGLGWLDRLAAIYEETDRLTHRMQPIPASPCSTTDEDIGLSLWHAVADGKTYSTDTSGDGIGAGLRHAGFLAKYIGDYADARRFAWRAVRHDPYQRMSWRLFAITLLGRAGRILRKVRRRA